MSEATVTLLGLALTGNAKYADERAPAERRVLMKRLSKALLGAIALTLTLALPAQASVKWVCNVPGEGDVTFVTAADAALHGISTANARAGQVFHDLFGEECRVVVDP